MSEEIKIPTCVGVIMDGNRRWAKARGLPAVAGHTEGYAILKAFLEWTKKAGIPHVIAYTFSIENWKRSSEEVAFLMSLVRKVFENESENFISEKIRVRFAGNLSLFPPAIAQGMKELEKKTEHFLERSLTLAVSYGGREEIVHAVNETLKEGKTSVTAEDISRHIYTALVPEPDLIIRTSGEMRLSGFLPWQSIYSELFFTKTLWPDFSEAEFNSILKEFNDRERRMGL